MYKNNIALQHQQGLIVFFFNENCERYKKYGLEPATGITRSASGTALNMLGFGSCPLPGNSSIDATFPHR